MTRDFDREGKDPFCVRCDAGEDVRPLHFMHVIMRDRARLADFVLRAGPFFYQGVYPYGYFSRKAGYDGILFPFAWQY